VVPVCAAGDEDVRAGAVREGAFEAACWHDHGRAGVSGAPRQRRATGFAKALRVAAGGQSISRHLVLAREPGKLCGHRKEVGGVGRAGVFPAERAMAKEEALEASFHLEPYCAAQARAVMSRRHACLLSRGDWQVVIARKRPAGRRDGWGQRLVRGGPRVGGSAAQVPSRASLVSRSPSHRSQTEIRLTRVCKFPQWFCGPSDLDVGTPIGKHSMRTDRIYLRMSDAAARRRCPRYHSGNFLTFVRRI